MSILRSGVGLYVSKTNSLSPFCCWISRSRQPQLHPVVISVRDISQKYKHSRHKEKENNKKDVNKKPSKVSLLNQSESSEPDITFTTPFKPPDSLQELQLDSPPVLFIQKYQQFIDTKDILVRDELSDLEKNGRITPSSMTAEKMEIIQKAVRETETFKQLVESLRKQPEPLLAPPRATTTQKSVFVDSDYEVIREERVGEGGKLSLTKYETELEWSSSRLDLSQLASHYLMLSKSRLTLLVCLTAGAGYGMAPGDLSLSTALLATLGTGMASSAANSINQILEVPFDSQMNRTKNRVLVRGQVSTLHAATFAGVLAVSSTALLYTLVNPLTAELGALNLFLYT